MVELALISAISLLLFSKKKEQGKAIASKPLPAHAGNWPTAFYPVLPGVEPDRPIDRPPVEVTPLPPRQEPPRLEDIKPVEPTTPPIVTPPPRQEPPRPTCHTNSPECPDYDPLKTFDYVRVSEPIRGVRTYPTPNPPPYVAPEPPRQEPPRLDDIKPPDPVSTVTPKPNLPEFFNLPPAPPPPPTYPTPNPPPYVAPPVIIIDPPRQEQNGNGPVRQEVTTPPRQEPPRLDDIKPRDPVPTVTPKPNLPEFFNLPPAPPPPPTYPTPNPPPYVAPPVIIIDPPRQEQNGNGPVRQETTPPLPDPPMIGPRFRPVWMEDRISFRDGRGLWLLIYDAKQFNFIWAPKGKAYELAHLTEFEGGYVVTDSSRFPRGSELGHFVRHGGTWQGFEYQEGIEASLDSDPAFVSAALAGVKAFADTLGQQQSYL